ncbi:MAG: hypothetical protein H0W06_02295 [Chloroflexia bacterium]|nr:hypothetical protein [Chloroflexia bacterium]
MTHFGEDNRIITTEGTTPRAEHLHDRREVIGAIVRVQVQVEPLKRGERGGRWYDPAPITEVAALRLDSGGVHGIDEMGGTVLDVHHRDHSHSRYRGGNGVSVGFTSHYGDMRAAFGVHLSDGVAGENILIASERRFSEEDLAGGLLIEAADGPVWLDQVVVATPCVEFSRFCVGLEATERPDQRVTRALQFLGDGVRGYYAAWSLARDQLDQPEPPPDIRRGDLVFRRLPRDATD